MELIKDEDEDKPAKLVPPDEDEDDEAEPDESSGGGPAWLRPLGAVLAVIIILFLLAILARWIYGEVTGDNSPNRPGGTSQGKPPATPGAGSNKNGAGNKQNGSSAAGKTNKNGQLPNNGPGDVAAIFVASSLAAAGLHFIIRTRRLSRAED